MLRIEQLPDDPAILKQLLVEECAARDAHIEQIKREAAERIEALQEKHQAELAAVLRRFYGPHSERFDSRQLLLFGRQVDTIPLDTPSIEEEAGEKLVNRRVQHKHGRQRLPENLPRVRIEHDLPDAEKPCPCCGEARQRIGEEVSEQLEFIPASLRVLEHVRFKYACKACEQSAAEGGPQIATAAKPVQPIEKGLAGPGLLAYVITSKLGDHLPLYRLEHIFARQGVHLARSTMCAWLQAAAELARLLVRLMTQRVRSSRAIHTDETRVPIPEPGTGRCRSGRLWCYIGDRFNPYVVYDYTPDRTRAGPTNWLANYKGYLQADAYGGYDGIYSRGDVIEVACWAHGRRHFFDAKETDGRRAAEMLAMIGELFAVEREAANLDDDARRALRQTRSVPALAKIKTWLDAEQELVLPRSPMAAAIGYVLNQWDALCVYTTQGFLAIDNNAAERQMKRIATGRKNWLFAGNDRAGATAATLYTLIASAERHGLDPQAYLTSVLAKIAATPVSDLEQFLPDVWKRENNAEPLTPSGAASATSPSPQA
jgi:transposase